MTAPRDTGTTNKATRPNATAAQDARAARLKAALKANIARRKEQARARAGDTADKPED
jgi:hypothetical protein